jgi:RNA polymerase sigma-70 factor, ECF subfamily
LTSTVHQKTQALVALAQAGDPSAHSQLCHVYAERVQWMVRFRMGRELRSKLESVDLVQNTLVRVLNGIKGFTYENEGDFVRWLSKIVENEVRANLKHLHAQKRDIRKERQLEDHGSDAGQGFTGTPGPVALTTPSIMMSRKEDLTRLEQAIETLKPEYREAILLAKIEGLSYEDIGKRLDKSTDAVRMLATRAMAALTTAFRMIQ